MNGGEMPRRTDGLLCGAAAVMILCCAVGPAVLGAAAGGIIGGWLGIVCARIFAATIAFVLHRRGGRGEC
jgi:hypothetical protein